MIRRTLSKRGLFISLEGTEGVGKSTLLDLLVRRLQDLAVPYVRTREPGGSPLAESIRTLVIQNSMSPEAELLLYEAARAEHCATVIRPALVRGEVVLCDRFTDSSLAYQGSARNLKWSDVLWLNRFATKGEQPDLTFLLKMDPAMALARAKDPNRFEAEGVVFQRKVLQGFLRAKREVRPLRWHVLSVGNQDPNQVLVAAWKRIEPLLNKRGLLP